MRLRIVALLLSAALLVPVPDATARPAPGPRLAELPIPGSPAFVKIARDVLDARVELAPNLAADAGLFDDAARVPSWSPATVRRLERQLRADLDALRALPREGLTVDEQIDRRWVAANAEEALQRLSVERLYEHRCAEWLEPLANTMLALQTYAPERVELREQIVRDIPGMVQEMRQVCVAPTQRDVTTAAGLVDGVFALLDQVPASRPRELARAELTSWRAGLLPGDREYAVIGAEAYAFRLARVMLLPWSPDELLALAQQELTRVDQELAGLEPTVPAPAPPTDEERALAHAYDARAHLGVYEDTVAAYTQALREMRVVTLPDDFAPLRARETPEAMIPLTGDGGSMNPPPLFGPAGPSWWNVDHFRPDWSIDQRLDNVLARTRPVETGMGTYAVHEGVPGHHLQLAMARRIENPLRTLMTDYAAVEGWALYAEEWFWEHGGFGDGPAARRMVLRSYRGRVRRVFYDVHVETGRWTLREAAAWRTGREGAEPDMDVLRAINWPTQLLGYFVGKQQIVALREEVKARRGAAWDERAFHDELLAAGLIPLSLVRAKMLGEPVPAL